MQVYVKKSVWKSAQSSQVLHRKWEEAKLPTIILAGFILRTALPTIGDFRVKIFSIAAKVSHVITIIIKGGVGRVKPKEEQQKNRLPSS